MVLVFQRMLQVSSTNHRSGHHTHHAGAMSSPAVENLKKHWVYRFMLYSVYYPVLHSPSALFCNLASPFVPIINKQHIMQAPCQSETFTLLIFQFGCCFSVWMETWLLNCCLLLCKFMRTCILVGVQFRFSIISLITEMIKVPQPQEMWSTATIELPDGDSCDDTVLLFTNSHRKWQRDRDEA